jgi:tetratricopeptide (TPR) repeat protein
VAGQFRRRHFTALVDFMVYAAEQICTMLKSVIRRGINLRLAAKCPADFQKAFDHYESIKDLFDDSEPEYLRHFYNGLGLVYFETGNYPKAIEYFDKALNLEAREEREQLDLAAVNVNMANVLLLSNRPGEAHAFLNQPAKYFQSIYDYANLGEVIETRARIFLIREEFDKAVIAAQEAYDLLRQYSTAEAKGRAARTLAACWEAKQRSVKQ